MMKYTVKLNGVDSEGKPLSQTWATRKSALEALAAVSQLLTHKADNEKMLNSEYILFNGTIEILEENVPVVKTQPLDSTDPRWTDLSTMKVLTCKNHPEMRFVTKNPWSRSIFVRTRPECDCPFSEMIEVVEES